MAVIGEHTGRCEPPGGDRNPTEAPWMVPTAALEDGLVRVRREVFRGEKGKGCYMDRR